MYTCIQHVMTRWWIVFVSHSKNWFMNVNMSERRSDCWILMNVRWNNAVSVNVIQFSRHLLKRPHPAAALYLLLRGSCVCVGVCVPARYKYFSVCCTCESWTKRYSETCVSHRKHNTTTVVFFVWPSFQLFLFILWFHYFLWIYIQVGSACPRTWCIFTSGLVLPGSFCL